MKDQSIAPCGTEAAYRRHRRHSEIPCQDCKRAAAAERRRRRGLAKSVDTPMGTIVTELPAESHAEAGPPDAPEQPELSEDGHSTSPTKLDYHDELGRLYGVLGHAIRDAAPRETASIVREMRAILNDLRSESGAESQGPSLKEQLMEAKRERAARAEQRKVTALAQGDVDAVQASVSGQDEETA